MDIDEALLMGSVPNDPVREDAERNPGTTTGTEYESFDTDADGHVESWVMHTDAGLTVARDRDRDGVIDTFTSIGRGGHYESWEIFRAADGSTRWDRTGFGEVFG